MFIVFRKQEVPADAAHAPGVFILSSIWFYTHHSFSVTFFTLGSRLIYCTVEDCKLIVQIHGICSSSGEDFGPLVPRFHQSALFSQSSWIFDWWCSRCTKIVLVRELSEESDQFRSHRHLSRLVSNLSRLNRSSESNSVYCFSTVFIFLQQQKVPEAKL